MRLKYFSTQSLGISWRLHARKEIEVSRLRKFSSNDYLKGDSLCAEYQGDVSICGNTITFSNLQFDEEVKININSLVLDKDKTYDTVDKEITIFFGSDEDGTTNKVDFETLDYEFLGCIFNKNVHVNPPENSHVRFDYCTFKEHFHINHGYFYEDQKIKIDNVSIENTTFERDFTVYKAEINSINIKNVDFASLSEFNEVTFQEKFDLKEITYKGFTLFDRCTFNTKAEFEYIIFEKFTSFRGTTFNKGLMLDFTSADKEINFFEIKGLDNNESKKNTSQETYRIIKYNFEKIGNKIEANQYHALELSKNRDNIWSQEDISLILIQRGIVSFIHWITSVHSTSWIIALFWIVIVSLVTTTCLGYDIGFDKVFQYSYVLTKVNDFNNNHIVFLLNKISLGYLYYQFLISIRQDTRK